MKSKKKLIKANDDLSRKVNRLKNSCEKCGRKAPYQLHWCHIYGRRAKNLRWAEINWLLLCATCHRWQHETPIQFTEWFVDTFGEDRKKALQKLQKEAKKMTVKDYERINLELKVRLGSTYAVKRYGKTLDKLATN